MGKSTSSLVEGTASLSPVGGMVSRNIQGQRAADAAGGLQQAQEAEQRRMRAEAQTAAKPSEYEINRLEDAYHASNDQLERSKRILDSADPALIEAGKQALALMQGKEAATLGPLKNQRMKQRAQLENQLRQRLGSGYAESSAGIQALTAFDEATDNTLATAQQQSLGQFLGVAQQSSAQNNLGNLSQQFGTLASLRGNINSREVNALNGNQVNAVGGDYMSQLIKAQNDMRTSKEATDYGQQIAGTLSSGFGGGGGSSSLLKKQA